MHLTNCPPDDEDDEQKKHTMKYLLGYLKEQKQDGMKIWHEIEVSVIININEDKIFISGYCIKNNLSR